MCDVNICSDPDFNSEKADFQAPLLWTYHHVPVIKTIHRGTFGSLHLPEKILTLLYFAESKGDMLKIWKFGQILKKGKKYPKLLMLLYLQPGIEPGSAGWKPTITTNRPSGFDKELEISKLYKDLTSSDQISLPLWNLSQILMVITTMLEKALCASLSCLPSLQSLLSLSSLPILPTFLSPPSLLNLPSIPSIFSNLCL